MDASSIRGAGPKGSAEIEARFVCLRCGQCCQGRGGVWLEKSELKGLSKIFGLGERAFREAYLTQRASLWQVKSSGDGYCLFYDHGCLAQALKPKACRSWPFFSRPVKSEGGFLEFRELCPGLRDFDYPAFLEAFRASGLERPF